MKRQRRFGTEVEAVSRKATQIKTLIESLSRRIQLLDYDIDNEKGRANCRDLREPGYPVLARSLIARRDNLIATVAALEERLAKAKGLQYARWLGGEATAACVREFPSDLERSTDLCRLPR